MTRMLVSGGLLATTFFLALVVPLLSTTEAGVFSPISSCNLTGVSVSGTEFGSDGGSVRPSSLAISADLAGEDFSPS